MNEETFKIWFAGFYEGEGSIVNDKSNNNRLRVCVSQNDKTPLELAKNIWGGSVRLRVRKSHCSDKICVGHEWRISHNESINFINDIQKYMIIPYKINQVKIAFEKFKMGNKERYKCNFCDKDYASPSGRRRHEIKEHIHKGELFKCFCSKSYKSKDSLNRHIKNNHK